MTSGTSHRTKTGISLALAALQAALDERPVVRRRRFTDEEKHRFLDEANQPGSSITHVAQRYDLALSLLFRWRKEFGEGPVPFAGFTPVSITDDGVTLTSGVDELGGRQSAALAHEASGGMEIALKDGKRVRVEAGADPEAGLPANGARIAACAVSGANVTTEQIGCPSDLPHATAFGGRPLAAADQDLRCTRCVPEGRRPVILRTGPCCRASSSRTDGWLQAYSRRRRPTGRG